MRSKKEGKVTIEHDGKEYSGHFRVDRGIVVVDCEYGTDKAQLTPGQNPEPYAKLLLSTIINKARGK